MLRLKAEEIKKQFQKGLDYRDKGNYKKAIKIFNKVLNNDPKFIKAWEVLGLAYLKTKTHFKSIEAFNQAIQLEPDNEKYQQKVNLQFLKNLEINLIFIQEMR